MYVSLCLCTCVFACVRGSLRQQLCLQHPLDPSPCPAQRRGSDIYGCGVCWSCVCVCVVVWPWRKHLLSGCSVETGIPPNKSHPLSGCRPWIPLSPGGADRPAWGAPDLSGCLWGPRSSPLTVGPLTVGHLGCFVRREFQIFGPLWELRSSSFPFFSGHVCREVAHRADFLLPLFSVFSAAWAWGLTCHPGVACQVQLGELVAGPWGAGTPQLFSPVLFLC